MGSGINTTFRQVGIATGVAGLGAVFQAQVGSKLSELLPHAPKGLGELVSVGRLSGRRRGHAPAVRPAVSHAATIAFVSGLNEILLIASVLSFVAAILGFTLVRSRDFFRPQAAKEAPAEPVAV